MAHSMDFVEGCPECERISGKYEAATMEWFRAQSQLGIAESLRDPKASEGIVTELAAIAKRRQLLREIADKHMAEDHATRTGTAGLRG
jgi:hypothetical protein